jgi:pyrroline-5-carboxylate reductase
MTRTIGFVGAGNMAEAMLRGLLRGEDFAAAHVSASGPRLERVQELREKYGINATTDNHVPASA